jgi:hypothetical protein
MNVTATAMIHIKKEEKFKETQTRKIRKKE